MYEGLIMLYLVTLKTYNPLILLDARIRHVRLTYVEEDQG